MRRRRFGNRRVAYARLHPGYARQRIDFQDALHFRHDQKQALLVGQCAARESCSRAAEHDRDAALVADIQNRADLVFVGGQGDHQRHALVGGHAVALEGFQILALMQQRFGGQHRREARDQIRLGDLRLERFGRK